jgi:(p)ppGpp synthase/HD superfamily hydrolase
MSDTESNGTASSSVEREPLFQPLVEHAIELASEWHDGTYRKSRWRDPAFEVETDGLRVPVISHLASVASMVRRAGWPDPVVAAAYLHDILEDPNQEGERFGVERLRSLVGDDVTRYVLDVSETKLDEYGNHRPWRDRKEGYIRQIRNGRSGSAGISLADKMHNLWSMNQTLDSGLDIFDATGEHTALSAGPKEQEWFYRSVLDATRVHEDTRLIPMREQLADELDRFASLVKP